MVVREVDHVGDLYTMDGAARALNVPYWSLVKHVERNNVPLTRIGGKLKLVRLADLTGVKKGQA